MPIYQFECLDCGVKDDYLVQIDGAPYECSSCNGEQLVRDETPQRVSVGSGSSGFPAGLPAESEIEGIVSVPALKVCHNKEGNMKLSFGTAIGLKIRDPLRN